MYRIVVLSAWLLVVGTAAAQGYRYHPYKMDCSPGDPFPYYTDGRLLSPAGLTLASVHAATTAAFKTWEDVPCAYTAFKALGTNTAGITDPRDPYDPYSVSTLWITANTDPYYLGPEVAAHTIPLAYGGVLFQCDIYMNAVDKKWSTASPTPSGVHDVQSLVLHEAGHCQGIEHNIVAINEVMDPTAPIGFSRRALGQNDQGALCARYPQSGAVGSPCGQDAGTCGGDGGLHCVIAPAPDGGTRAPMCTIGCPSEQTFQCPMGFACKPSTLVPGSSGACLPAGPELQTQVGKPCRDANQCGSANAVCQPEIVFPSGGAGWKAGYCTHECAGSRPPCPGGSRCVPLDSTSYCLKECTLGAGDCRPGYTCSAVGPGGGPVCVPVCYGDMDCNPPGQSGSVCRTCDGTCLARQNPTGQIGDPCNDSSVCGLGQVCGKFSNGTAGVCTQSCALACSACPSGTTCHAVGPRGELYCLRSCSIGSCPAGLQCGQLATGQGCIPPCTGDVDCPVGNQCFHGQCLNPALIPDAGCALCPSSDAGRPTDGAPRDGGVGSGHSSGGCGCGSPAPAGHAGWLLALGLLRAVRGRGRRTSRGGVAPCGSGRRAPR